MSDQLVAIQLEGSNGSLLVRVSGEIDLSNSYQLHQELESAIERWPRVVIDLAEIRYLDSQGLRLIKQLCTKINNNGSELQLVAPPNSFARQVLEMTRISDHVKLRDTVEG
jgi:anti-sigma B factor antagonist